MVFSLKKNNWGHYLHIKIYISYIKLNYLQFNSKQDTGDDK